jgi:polysaccharide biosynthesis protein PslH
MRILFLTHRLPYAPNRGDRIRAFYLLREMSRFADVSLFSLVHDDEELAKSTTVPFTHDVTCRRVHYLANLARGATRLATTRPLTHSLLDAADIHSDLRALVDRHPFDLVVAFCSGMARFALEPPLVDLPFVLDMVDVDSVKWDQLANVSRGPRRWIYRREARTLRAFERTAATRARASLVVNDRERIALERIAPDARVVVVPAGIDLDVFKPSGPPAAEPIVVFCGVMNYHPNERAVAWFAGDVWPQVRSAIPDARFMIVGSSPTRAVKQLAEVDASIEIVGQVPTVQPYLWKSAVAVAPIHLAQGIQTKVFEALAAGLPSVITPAVARGLPSSVVSVCSVAEGADPFARAIIDLLRRPAEERRRLAASAPLDSLRWSEQLREVEPIMRSAAQPLAVAAG